MYQTVINFWFQEIDKKLWFSSTPDFDELIKKQFSSVLLQASAGELFDWRKSIEGRLAEIIVLDQFSRNIYRNTPAAFAQDPMALILAQEALSAGALTQLEPVYIGFLLLPYMHSESKKIHEMAEILYRKYAPSENYDFELKHKRIIDKFGRYPHRNAVLGRESTQEEREFLSQPGSSF